MLALCTDGQEEERTDDFWSSKWRYTNVHKVYLLFIKLYKFIMKQEQCNPFIASNN